MMVLWMALALAGPADDLLAEVDEASNPATDAHLVLQVDSVDHRGRESTRTLEIWQKGDDKRLVRFTAPPRVAGIALLVPDGETLYLYLPSYGRPRRVVGESRGDAFFGTNFAMEDLARMSWAADFTPALAEDGHLTLTPKAEAEVSSARVELWVRPEDHLPSRVEHYDAQGALLRRIAFSDVRPVDGRPLAHAVVVEDVARSRTTRATVLDAAFDRGVDDERFTLSELQP